MKTCHTNLEEQFQSRLLRKTLYAWIISIPLFIISMFDLVPDFYSDQGQIVWWLCAFFSLSVLVYSAGHMFKSAFKAFGSQHANMDTLIVIGTSAAWLYSTAVLLFPNVIPELARHVYFEASSLIIAFVNLGAFLEARAQRNTSAAIKKLIGLQPKTAKIIVDEGHEKDVPIDEVKIGDLIRIKPGNQIPVDGTITLGESYIDESMLTGEPVAIKKQQTDHVAAGTMNQSGSFFYKATAVGKDTALARIISLVQQAQNSKPAIGRLVDKISSYFVPIVLITAIITALVWLNFGPEPKIAFMIATGMTVLIIACPCALGLGTPMSIMVGVGKAAENGILIRDGDALQTASKIDVVVLDKTGTITQGKPTVSQVYAASNLDKTKIIQIAASIEANSEHPLAAAIVESAQHEGVELFQPEEFKAISGKGVICRYEKRNYFLGNYKLMHDNKILLAEHEQTANHFAGQGQTVIYLATDNELLGIIGISDAIKPDSLAAIQALQQQGIKVVMLTGDNQHTAQVVANEVGVDKFIADVLPQEKLDYITKLQKGGKIVAMVGDGINDAPALSQANVGFAIGSGTDVAIESADITLLRNSLVTVPQAIQISHATLRNIKQNLFFAFIYNGLGIPVAAGILYPVFGILLSPVIAGAAMAASSLTIVLNANRLRFVSAYPPLASYLPKRQSS